MSVQTAVIIARPEMAPALRKRLAHDPDAVVYTTAESLRALETIRRHKPKVIAVDAKFAVSARGAALAAAVRADPLLAGTDVRVLIEDETHTPVVLDRRITSAEAVLRAGSRPLDRCGTRQRVRVGMNESVKVSVNGAPGDLVDLSVNGAQIIARTRLRPDESVLLVFSDGSAETRCRTVVVWATAESAQGSLRYRAGVQFIDAERDILEAFCAKHGTPAYGSRPMDAKP